MKIPTLCLFISILFTLTSNAGVTTLNRLIEEPVGMTLHKGPKYNGAVIIKDQLTQYMQCKITFSDIALDQSYYATQCYAGVVMAQLMTKSLIEDIGIPLKNGSLFSRNSLSDNLVEGVNDIGNVVPSAKMISPHFKVNFANLKNWIVRNIDISGIPVKLLDDVLNRTEELMRNFSDQWSNPILFAEPVSQINELVYRSIGEMKKYYDIYPSVSGKCKPKYLSSWTLNYSNGVYGARIDNLAICRNGQY